MRALDVALREAMWAAIVPLLPERVDNHPLGCHRRRVPDRVCFDGIMIRLVTGCSWIDAEVLMGGVVSDTTLRSRRDEWVKAKVFDRLVAEALRAYDRVIGLDLSEVAVDGSQHKAPCGGEGTGPSPTDRAKLGWKWSIATDRNGIPLGWAIDGANRHDTVLFAPTLKMVADTGLVVDIETLHLDRGYDSAAIRQACADTGITDVVAARKRKPGQPAPKKKLTLGMRWPVERSNSWLSNFGQLRRNTDRASSHRIAQLALAIASLITGKLIDWRDRWDKRPVPIR